MWKYIEGYEGRYKINTEGVIVREEYSYIDNFGKGRKRHLPSKVIAHTLCKNGYYMVDLRLNGKTKRHYVHRLLAKAFIPNPNNLPFINHKDENKQNNSLDNLEWCTCSYNNTYNDNRKRMAETRKNNGTYACTEEQRLKISKALKGKPKSESHKQHMRGHNNNRYK